MIAFGIARVTLHLFVGLAICSLVFPWIGPAARNAHIKCWSRRLLAICKVKAEFVDASGGTLAPRALIVCNHVSWLDIFVIDALEPCRFVAKSDIRGWPLIGKLCDMAGTIFLTRGRPRDVRRIYEGLVTSIRNGERVAVFPEGTTVSQGSVLPFHANLLQAAIDAEAQIQPYAVRYVDADGKLHEAVDFIGDMTFVQSMIAILKARPVTAQLLLLPAVDTGGAHRRELAPAARRAVAAALGYPVEEAAAAEI